MILNSWKSGRNSSGKQIAKENKFTKKMEKALKEVLYIGDGAFKIAIDTTISEHPILEWYPVSRLKLYGSGAG